MKRTRQANKAQSTAEYAILIALVIGAVVAMQTYAQRTLQGRVRGASIYLMNQTSNLEGDTGSGAYNTLQYEPYYANTTTRTTRVSDDLYNQAGQRLETNTSVEAGNSVERSEYTKPLDSWSTY